MLWYVLIGILLILHGMISSMFLFYVKTPDKEDNFGWSRKSWVLNKFLSEKSVKIVGLAVWVTVIAVFIISGILILARLESWRTLAIIAAFISLFAYLIFWTELKPKPINFIAGPSVAIGIIITLLIINWPLDTVLFA
jgi:hypothetical protein